jgi:hypothetical protein
MPANSLLGHIADAECDSMAAVTEANVFTVWKSITRHY